MRAGIIGFFLGAGVAVLTFVITQRVLISPVANELTFHFHTTVFGTPHFPDGDVDNGRVLRRAMLPIQITKTFYDAHYHEVTQADKPGRYGAMVKIETNGGGTVRKFITLYRTPADIFWDVIPLPITAELPPELGIDPVVLRNQQHEIGELIESSMIDDDGDTTPAFAILLAGLSETSPHDPPAVERTGVKARDAAWWYGLRQRIGLMPTYPHLVDLPRNYDADPNKHWPLLLYLHNAAERGDDLRDVRVSGLAGLIAKGKQLPAIVVSPQCPSNEPWNTEILSHLLDEMEVKYRVDPDRVYVSGISAGGDETWDFALAHPGRLAAIIPICGESDPVDGARIKNLPIWAFQGKKDNVVPFIQAIRMTDAIRNAGGHPHLTLYPDAGHDSWDEAYATEALYTWLFAQKRGQPEVITPGVPSS